MYMKFVPFVVVAAALSLPTLADEASVKKALEAKLGAPVTSVTKTPYLGLYEVYADGQIVYTDEKVSALLVGSLIDGKTMKNVTSERMQKLTAIKFSDLPLTHAIKQVRGDGKRVFASFRGSELRLLQEIGKRTCQAGQRHRLYLSLPDPVARFTGKVQSDLVFG
jgi:thiol:disulfide interchange protein DsbC